MNRAARLLAALDGTGLEDRAADLAGLPAGQVDLIAAMIRAAGRAALAGDRQRRRQRREDRRRYRHIEDPEQADACDRQALAFARRAASNLYTLARLSEHYDDGPAVLALAVAGLRSEGYSDAEIGAALGISRQAVGQRFGRKREVHTGPAGRGRADAGHKLASDAG